MAVSPYGLHDSPGAAMPLSVYKTASCQQRRRQDEPSEGLLRSCVAWRARNSAIPSAHCNAWHQHASLARD